MNKRRAETENSAFQQKISILFSTPPGAYTISRKPSQLWGATSPKPTQPDIQPASPTAPSRMGPGEQTITNDEMLAAEYNSEYLGVTHFQLMETVGARIADRIAEKTRGKTNPRLHV